MLPIRVDFYLLGGEDATSPLDLACKLLEKAYYRGHQVFVYCDDEAQAFALDEKLWTFKDESFIPHNLQGEGPEPPPPIQIGFNQTPRGFTDILLNLSAQGCPFFEKFNRVLEIISPNDQDKSQGRERYRSYKASGCALYTHEIS